MSDTSETLSSYQRIVQRCKKVFEEKAQDYGTAWRILRVPSITDQIFIKASRIRSIQEKGRQKVADGIVSEFYGIINYCVMALIQMELQGNQEMELPVEEVMQHYDEQIAKNLALLSEKNHDYNEAWRLMRVSSITDIILMKILRVKQIEDNEGKTKVSEGIDANYRDMINYAVFSLILIEESEEN